MHSLNNLISICSLYKRGTFGLEEYQSRLNTAAIPENTSKEFLSALVRFDNQLEEIMFCHSENEHKKYADKVADKLIEEINLEQKRQRGYRPYQR